MVKRSYSGDVIARSTAANKRAKSVLSRISKRIPVPEVKIIQTPIDTRIYGTGSTSTIATLLNGPAIGTDIDNRIGRSIKNMSVEMTLEYVLGATTTEYDAGNWFLIWDKRPNGSLPPYAEVFTTQISLTRGHSILNEVTHPGRFQCIARGDWTVGIAKGWQQRVYKNISLKGRVAKFNNLSSQGNITQADDGALVFYSSCSDKGTIFANGTQVRAMFKVKYTDV